MAALRRLLPAVLGLTLPVALAAQQPTGVLAGTVTDAESKAPVAAARVELLAIPARRLVAATTTNGAGRYTMARVPAGAYALVVTRIGFSLRRIDAVTVDAGNTTTVDVALAPLPTELEQVVTSASRAPEKVLDAPASISVVGERQLREKPAITAADYVRGQPGVDATQGGLAQTNIVARGFNNAFSGSLLMLQDNRFASVPSLRVNIPFLVPTTNEDIERIEIVLGPGAALYGPNASAGVMHVITKSPFDSKGTTLTLDGGERSVLRLGMRHANTIGDRVGFKLSGEYMRGKDWEYRDPAEPSTFPGTSATPQARRGQPNARDFDLERYGGEARTDVRLPDGSELITTFGLARIVSGLELTGANGTAQVRDWLMQTGQVRYRKGRFFAQAFGNMSDAGNEDGADLGGTFLLRTGQPIVDRSRLGAVQFQQGIPWGTRQTFLVGGEGVWTNPRTEHTINGRNEDDDNTTEVGGYVHSVTRLSPRWDFVSALRVDVNSRLDGRFYSPRAAVVWKPTATQNVRWSYNRAYSTPTNFNLYLDLLQGSLRDLPVNALPYDIRALGVPEDGFTFRRDCTRGIGGLCMRSPFQYANGSVAANAFSDAVGYQNALAVAIARGATASISAAIRQNVPSLTQAQADAMAGAAVARMVTLNPTAAQAGTTLRLLVPGSATPFQPYATDEVRDIAPLKASYVNNYEVGYKGIIGDRLRVAVDGWYQRRENFVTAALNFTPNVFVGASQAAALINPEMRTAFYDYLRS